MSDIIGGIGEANPHLPALQQTQTVSQPPTAESGQADDPNSGNRTKDLQDEAVSQHIVDEAAKREDRGQQLNITI